MSVYLFTFFVSCMSAYMAIKNKKNKVIYFIFVSVALILPSFIAGVRDPGVGTDTLIYGQKYFEYAHRISIIRFFTITDCELAYGLLVYLIAYFTDNIFWMYFVIELIILIFIWKSLIYLLYDKYIIYGLLVYYFLFYSFSLNLMRQSVAMAIILYSYRFVKERNLLKFLMFFVLAFLFQKTVIVAIILYPLYQMIRNDKDEFSNLKVRSFFKKLIKYFRWPLIVSGILLSFFIVKNAAEIITFIHFYFDDFYGIYRDIQSQSSSSLAYTLYALVIVGCFFVEIKKKNSDYVFLIILSILHIILYQVKQVSTQAYRISMYFSIFWVVGIPQYLLLLKNENNKKILKLVFGIVITLYAYDFFVIRLYNATYPYTSTILGIG